MASNRTKRPAATSTDSSSPPAPSKRRRRAVEVHLPTLTEFPAPHPTPAPVGSSLAPIGGLLPGAITPSSLSPALIVPQPAPPGFHTTQLSLLSPPPPGLGPGPRQLDSHQLHANPASFGNGGDSRNGIHESQQHLHAVTHATRLEMVQQRQETTKTGATYSRHVDNYSKYWSALQDAYCAKYPMWTRVPAFPITAMKAALFVRYEMQRPKIVKSNKKQQSSSMEYQEGTTLGVQSIKQAINALEAYRRDHAWEYPPHHETQIKLRDDLRIRTIEDDAAKNESQRIDMAQKLKAAGTSADTYTKDDLIRLSRNALCDATTSSQLVVGIRDRAMLLLASQTAFRGDNLRNIQLSDLFLTTVPNPHAGPEAYFEVMGILADQGKTNQHSRVDEFGSLRHKRPELCAVGALALYLFALWHPDLGNEPLPSFAPVFSPAAQEEGFGTFGKREWYGLYVFKPEGKTCKEPMKYSNHYKRVKKMHDDAGISISKATHAGRAKAAQTAREYGASVNDTKALGLWNESGSYRSCYDRLFPIGAMLGAANHLATQPEAFCVARAALDVPDELLGLVFPWLEREEAALLERSRVNTVFKDIALVQLIRMLKWMRKVLIQDLAVLYSMQPRWSSHIFNFKPFNLPIFDTFARGVATRLADIENTARLRLDQFPERIAGGFRSAILDFALQQRTEQAANRQLLDDLHQQIATLAAVVRDVKCQQPVQPVQHAWPAQATHIRYPLGNPPASYGAMLRAQQATLIPNGGHWPNGRVDTEPIPEQHTPWQSPPRANLVMGAGALSPAPSPSPPEGVSVTLLDDFPPALSPTPAYAHLHDHVHAQVHTHTQVHVHAHTHTPVLGPASVHVNTPARGPVHLPGAMPALDHTFTPSVSDSPASRAYSTILPMPAYVATGAIDPAALVQNWRDICARYAAHRAQIEAHRAAGEWHPSKDGRSWVPSYKFSSNTGLLDLWKEWTEGHNGKLSIEALDTGWGATWRTTKALRAAHCRRARVIGLLQKLANLPRWGIHLAIQFLETRGRAYSKHTTLYNVLTASDNEARLLVDARTHKF